VKQVDPRVLFKTASKGVCTSPAVVSPDPLSPTPSTSSAMKTLENTEDDPNDPEPAAGGGIQIECSSESVVLPKYRSRNKKISIRT
jgi:hypothetical protein